MSEVEEHPLVAGFLMKAPEYRAELERVEAQIMELVTKREALRKILRAIDFVENPASIALKKSSRQKRDKQPVS